MRILIVIGGYFPGKKCGGPPVSVDNFCTLMKDFECFIVTVNHDLLETTPYENILEGWNDRGNSKVLYLSDEEYKKATFEKIIEEIEPDLLYLQGVFQSCVLPCLQLAKKYSIPVLLAPRGELCEGAFNLKRYKKEPYVQIIRMLGLVRNIHWQSTSEDETRAIKKLMKADDVHIHRLDNIPSLPRMDYPRIDKRPGEGRFVFLSRIHPKKNLLFAISIFREIEGKVQFDIYGPIEDKEYWERSQDEIKKLTENIKVEYKGLVNHDEVHKVFSQYDAFIFPTLSENYGHVIAESLIVGTPVIISDQTPWTDINDSDAGWALSLDSKQEFSQAVQAIVGMDTIMFESLRKRSLQYVAKKTEIDKLRSVYESCFKQI